LHTDSVHDVQEGPRSVRNERADEMDTPQQDTGPRGCEAELEASRGVEVNRDYRNIVNSAKYDGIGPKSDRNERDVDANMSC
jgi:hypothetical protein